MKKIYLLRVFLASPSDVPDERLAVKEVLDQINIIHGSEKNIRLELVSWENSTYPDFGADAQDVISNQIKDKYDIFLGVLWKRFGTPTKRAESGTEEEFENALKLMQAGKILGLLMYFKSGGVESINSIDIDQLSSVFSFKKRIQKSGIYSFDFRDLDSFKSNLTVHLSHLINNLELNSIKHQENDSIEKTEKKKHDILTPQEVLELVSTQSVDDDLGIFEYDELASEALNELTATTKKIHDSIEAIGIQANSRTTEIEGVVKIKDDRLRQNKAKFIFNNFAGDMDKFNERLEFEIPLYKENSTKAFNYYSKSILLNPQKNEFKQDFTSLKDSLGTAISSISSFLKTVYDFPRFTGKLSKSKRKTEVLLSELLQEMINSKNLLDDFSSSFES